MGLHVSLKLTAYIHETIFTLWDYMCPWDWVCPWDRLPLFVHSAFIDQVISDHWFHLKLFEFMSSHLDKLTQPSLQSSISGSIRAIFTTYGMVLIPNFWCIALSHSSTGLGSTNDLSWKSKTYLVAAWYSSSETVHSILKILIQSSRHLYFVLCILASQEKWKMSSFSVSILSTFICNVVAIDT